MDSIGSELPPLLAIYWRTVDDIVTQKQFMTGFLRRYGDIDNIVTLFA
jgi:hypothetical protein